jgi:hypothetical protein
MTTYVSRRLNILCNIPDYSFSYNIAVLPVYVRVGIFYTSWKYLHDRIVSLRWEGWAYKSSLALTLFIEAPVLSQETERSCICVLVVPILPLSTIFLMDFGAVPTVWYFLSLIFLNLCISSVQQLKMKKSECIKC